MSSSQTSPQILLAQLVQNALCKTLGSSHRAVHLGESAEDVAKLGKRLHRKLFDTLITSLPGPLQRSSAGSSSRAGRLGPKERLIMVVFRLRERRKFDEADQLETILDHLSKLKDEDKDQLEHMNCIAEFLLALAGSKQSSHRLAIGHTGPLLPSAGPNENAVLPEGAWFHGDGRHIHRCDQHRGYIHYDRELFECRQYHQPGNDSGISEISCNESHLDTRIFETEPGRDLRGNRLFAAKSIMGNTYERETKETLFGGLVHSRVANMDAHLSIPSLPDTSNPAFLGLRIPALAESTVSDDEGYHESISDSMSAVCTPEKESLWDAALKYKPCRHRTWENIGNRPRPTERPYLTEAGPASLDLVYELRCREASIIQPSDRPPLTIFKDQRRLLQHAWNVLIGLPSQLFVWDKDTLSFSVNPSICLTGTTPESLHQLLAWFASAGTDYNRLWSVSQQPITDSTYTGGLVLQAFLGALRRYLQYYNAQVLLAKSRMDHGKRPVTLHLIRSAFSRLMGQLRYLARLCRCEDRRGSKPGGRGDPLPIGIQLLSHLYQEALDCTGTDNYRLMLSLLRSSCAPYLMFIQDWVFHGICRDTYGEFMIQAHHTYLFHRDKHYWTHGYILMSGESAVPMFLQELSSDIYTCGKAINLLKLCAPEHFVCNVTIDTPCIGLTFSMDELTMVTSRTKTYVKHMEVLAGLLTVSRREKERREEEARIELIAVARRTAAEEQQRFNEILKEQQEAVDAKKRKELRSLKEQMQKDLLRRAQKAENEKEEDRERIEKVTRREQAVREEESELEKQAREEVVKFYEELSKEATLREQRALWRIRRAQLERQRMEFWMQEKEALEEELKSPPPSARGKKGASQGGGASGGDFLPVSQTRVDDDAVGVRPDGKSSDVTESDFKVGGVEQSSSGDEPTVSHPEVSSEQTDSALTGETSNVSSATQAKLGGDGHKDREGALSDVDEDDDDHDHVVLGDVENKELEPVLALIQTSIADPPPTQKLRKKKKAISIREFLPRDQQSPDDAEPLDSDDEQAKDTTVEDVLLEIGSSLPSQEAASAGGALGQHPAPGESNILDDLLGSEKRADADGGGDGIIGLPQRQHAHGHPSDASLHKSDSTPPGTFDVGHPWRHERGHVSDSSLQAGAGSLDGLKKEDDSNAIPLMGVPQRQHQHGHMTESTVQTLGSQTDEGEIDGSTGIPHRTNIHGHPSQVSGIEHGKSYPRNVHGHMSDSSIGTHTEDAGVDGVTGIPHLTNVHGHPSQLSGIEQDKLHPRNVHGHSSDSSLGKYGHPSQLADTDEGKSHPKNIHGHMSDSTLGTHTETDTSSADRPLGLPSHPHVHGHSSDSTMKDVMSGKGRDQELTRHPSKEGSSNDPASDSGYDTSQVRSSSSDSKAFPGLPHRPTLAHQRPPLETSASADNLPGVPHLAHLHGHASDSSLGGIMYPSRVAAGDGGPLDGVAGRKDEQAAVSLLMHGHPSDSSAQRLMYPIKEAAKEQEQAEPEELPVTVWVDEGRESMEFDFTVFEDLPNTDLLGRTGFEPLRSEIGDYGVHASQSESIDATDLLPLPIIIKRSITAPLRAQVWLVNQSILDYFLVDLRIDKHFAALRRFLFLQDGEFGQALCDQIFDKLAHCLHVQELLTPLTLNQILSRSIQLSASANSEHADNLSFALKWHPSVLKPNAIDTLDCLELRYNVDWPNNIVITDTCLSKYNKVFSFLLQLKRTGWVLRDIHHQLKISAMLHKADSSPQYHQLQLFRHEMQHFVNVMQGYVVNQVIHVSWEEFQQDLKENVHSLDDLREKHALHLNKAILRCLLNKKAAPVMKIICDILSLVLKVRTQLTNSPWTRDAMSGKVLHPSFRNIKKSYMAFKEYSGFLYKVVAKLVTRGYQPHLEEFMLRLNFNDYYQEHKS